MEHKQLLTNHVEGLFMQAPKNQAVFELKEEVLANGQERFDDLVESGKSPDEALKIVQAGIGDVDELIRTIQFEAEAPYSAAAQEYRQKSALITSIAVGLYIFAAVVCVVGMYTITAWRLQGVVMAISFLLCIPPTIMLVYNAKMKPRYEKKGETVVENFKEWNNNTQRSRSIRLAVSGIIWSLAATIFFVVSFVTFAWYITWIIFLIAGCVEAVTTLIFKLKEIK